MMDLGERLVRGKRYRFEIEGFVYSNFGGFISICSEPPAVTYSPDETMAYGYQGSRVTIPETMIIVDPVIIADYVPGTLFEYSTGGGGESAHLIYDPSVEDKPWKIVGSQRRLSDAGVDRRYLVRLYRQGEREGWR